MSRKPQANANLIEANKVKASGARSKIDADPEVKQFIDYHLKKGGESNRTIHRMTMQKFGKERVSSLPAFNTYAARYRKETAVTVPDSFAQKYLTFDPLQNMIEEAERTKEIVVIQHEREKKLMATDIGAKYSALYMEQNLKISEEFGKRGLIRREPEPPSTVVNVQNNNTQVNGENVVVTTEGTILDRLIAIEKERKEYADSHARTVKPDDSAGVDGTETDVQQRPDSIQ